MNEALIEAVAKAIWDDEYEGYGSPWDEQVDRTRDDHRGHARAALEAIEAAGYVVAPATATDAMIAAARGNNYEWPASCYNVMIDARPKVTP